MMYRFFCHAFSTIRGAGDVSIRDWGTTHTRLGHDSYAIGDVLLRDWGFTFGGYKRKSGESLAGDSPLFILGFLLIFVRIIRSC